MKRASSLLLFLIFGTVVLSKNVSIVELHRNYKKLEFLTYKVRTTCYLSSGDTTCRNYTIMQVYNKDKKIISVEKNQFDKILLTNSEFIYIDYGNEELACYSSDFDDGTEENFIRIVNSMK